MFLSAVYKFLYITWTFLLIGALTFGGGYGMIPIMHHDLVIVKHWLTEQQFQDAVAVGLITPGPVAIMATFIGFQVMSFWGALAATIGVFSPSIGVVYFASRFYARFEESKWAVVVLPVINSTVIGLLAMAVLSLGHLSVTNLWMVLMTLITFILTIKTKLSPIWMILICGVIGLIWF